MYLHLIFTLDINSTSQMFQTIIILYFWSLFPYLKPGICQSQADTHIVSWNYFCLWQRYVCMCVCVYVCLFICLSFCVCMCVCVCTYMCVYVCIYIYICVYVCVCVCVCVYDLWVICVLCVCVCVRVCVCMCMWSLCFIKVVPSMNIHPNHL